MFILDQKAGAAGSRSEKWPTAAIAALSALAMFAAPIEAHAASSDSCAEGGFVISGLLDGDDVSQDGDSVIAAANVGSSFQVLGRYIEFTIVAATFGIENYVFTGAANPQDITDGRRTVVFQEKTPDHRGIVLRGNIQVELKGSDLVIERSGPGLDMKIQAKDCAQGGIFQMEPERDDTLRTRITHVLASGAFYFDNPNFRARQGDIVPFKNTTIAVPSRVNIGNDLSNRFVARDSAQVADRVQETTCVNQIRTRTGGTDTVLHCGQVSRWDIASGGRMGFVTGEDAVEAAPPPTDCVRNCQAQNRVRGRAVVLGFPFAVPQASRLRPATP